AVRGQRRPRTVQELEVATGAGRRGLGAVVREHDARSEPRAPPQRGAARARGRGLLRLRHPVLRRRVHLRQPRDPGRTRQPVVLRGRAHDVPAPSVARQAALRGARVRGEGRARADDGLSLAPRARPVLQRSRSGSGRQGARSAIVQSAVSPGGTGVAFRVGMRPRPAVTAAAIVLAGASTLLAARPAGPRPTTPRAPAPRPTYWPTRAWRTAPPPRAGFKPELTPRLDRYVKGTLPHVRSVLVVRHGLIVHERYYQGTDRETLQPLASVTKSVTSMLVGVALRQ